MTTHDDDDDDENSILERAETGTSRSDFEEEGAGEITRLLRESRNRNSSNSLEAFLYYNSSSHQHHRKSSRTSNSTTKHTKEVARQHHNHNRDRGGDGGCERVVGTVVAILTVIVSALFFVAIGTIHCENATSSFLSTRPEEKIPASVSSVSAGTLLGSVWPSSMARVFLPVKTTHEEADENHDSNIFYQSGQYSGGKGFPILVLQHNMAGGATTNTQFLARFHQLLEQAREERAYLLVLHDPAPTGLFTDAIDAIRKELECSRNEKEAGYCSVIMFYHGESWDVVEPTKTIGSRRLVAILERSGGPRGETGRPGGD